MMLMTTDLWELLHNVVDLRRTKPHTTWIQSAVTPEDDFSRDVRGGLLFRGAGRGGAKVKIHGAGRGGAKVKIRGAGRGGAKKRANQPIQKFYKTCWIKILPVSLYFLFLPYTGFTFPSKIL